MLAKYGISLPAFSEFINVALSGKVVSQVNENGKVFDLTVKVNDSDRSTMEAIGELTLDANGRKVPLEYVAEILPLSGPNTISPRKCTTQNCRFSQCCRKRPERSRKRYT